MDENQLKQEINAALEEAKVDQKQRDRYAVALKRLAPALRQSQSGTGGSTGGMGGTSGADNPMLGQNVQGMQSQPGTTMGNQAQLAKQQAQQNSQEAAGAQPGQKLRQGPGDKEV